MSAPRSYSYPVSPPGVVAAPYPPPCWAQVGLQEASVGVRVATDAAGALLREPLPGAPLGALDCRPHPLRVRKAQVPGEHGGDPLPLGLHYREQPSGRVDETGEVQPAEPGGNDGLYSGKSRPLADSSEEDKKGRLIR
jgi:hypothetical protein